MEWAICTSGGKAQKRIQYCYLFPSPCLFPTYLSCKILRQIYDSTLQYPLHLLESSLHSDHIRHFYPFILTTFVISIFSCSTLHYQCITRFVISASFSCLHPDKACRFYLSSYLHPDKVCHFYLLLLYSPLQGLSFLPPPPPTFTLIRSVISTYSSCLHPDKVCHFYLLLYSPLQGLSFLPPLHTFTLTRLVVSTSSSYLHPYKACCFCLLLISSP